MLKLFPRCRIEMLSIRSNYPANYISRYVDSALLDDIMVHTGLLIELSGLIPYSVDDSVLNIALVETYLKVEKDESA